MIGQTRTDTSSSAESEAPEAAGDVPTVEVPQAPEFGGREGLEPTRYGDWEKNGRCIDF
jgi:hypothetical protein